MSLRSHCLPGLGFPGLILPGLGSSWVKPSGSSGRQTASAQRLLSRTPHNWGGCRRGGANLDRRSSGKTSPWIVFCASSYASACPPLLRRCCAPKSVHATGSAAAGVVWSGSDAPRACPLKWSSATGALSVILSVCRRLSCPAVRARHQSPAGSRTANSQDWVNGSVPESRPRGASMLLFVDLTQ